MAKLILSMDGLVLNEIALAKERTTIGRKPHNDIQIDNLAISGEHAVILTLLQDSFLEDLNSTNGTFVNGQAIKRHFLQTGDVIELGKYRIKYVNEPVVASGAIETDKTVVLRPDEMSKLAAQMKPQVAGAEAALSPTAEAPPAKAFVQILAGAGAGKEMEITKSLTTLGRQGVQVAIIARRPQGYFLTHVEGSRFPVVGNVTLEANKPHLLQNHDIIEISGVKMEFYVKN
jgi:pSer/pThr/pTyr-binding forkhead associated (FHA) protein